MLTEEEQKLADAETRQQEVVKKLVADGIAEALKPLQAQLETDKAEKAGQDRKIADLLADKDAAEKKAAAESGSWQEANAAILATMEAKDKAALADKAAATVREKKLQWQTAATKRNLPPDIFVDSSLSVEDGEKYLDTIRGAMDEQVKVELTAQLGAGFKPGSGNLLDSTAKDPDRTNWTNDQFIAEAEAEMQTDLKKARGE